MKTREQARGIAGATAYPEGCLAWWAHTSHFQMQPVFSGKCQMAAVVTHHTLNQPPPERLALGSGGIDPTPCQSPVSPVSPVLVLSIAKAKLALV